MNSKHTMRAARVLKIHCPIDIKSMQQISAGQIAQIDPECALAKILNLVGEGGSPLGDFGIYKSVVELSAGWEMFTPDSSSRPTLGQAGLRTVSPTAILTVYMAADSPADAVSGAIDAILVAHPWEVPVIELSETSLIVRG